MTMTLVEVRDWLREAAKHDGSATNRRWFTRMADAIDAHLAGMGEPVYQIRTSETTWTEISKATYENPNFSEWQHRTLYTAPPVDIAAVREVIAEIQSLPAAEEHRWLADRLTAALPKETP